MTIKEVEIIEIITRKIIIPIESDCFMEDYSDDAMDVHDKIDNLSRTCQSVEDFYQELQDIGLLEECFSLIDEKVTREFALLDIL